MRIGGRGFGFLISPAEFAGGALDTVLGSTLSVKGSKTVRLFPEVAFADVDVTAPVELVTARIIARARTTSRTPFALLFLCFIFPILTPLSGVPATSQRMGHAACLYPHNHSIPFSPSHKTVPLHPCHRRAGRSA
jgi:hypothetical protein